jgi:hypothetical protein
MRSLFTPADGTTIAPVTTLFTEELDGLTFGSLEELANYHFDHQAESEADDFDPDMAYERHLETNDQYRWEHEQDELRAAFFGGGYYA